MKNFKKIMLTTACAVAVASSGVALAGPANTRTTISQAVPNAPGVEINGRIETSLYQDMKADAISYTNWIHHLNLGGTFSNNGGTTAGVETNVYLIPDVGVEDGQDNSSFGIYLDKLFVRHQFGRAGLTLGRFPVSWSKGMLVNPLDYNVSIDGQQYRPAVNKENAIMLNAGIGKGSKLTVVNTVKSDLDNGKIGVKYDTSLFGIGLTGIFRSDRTIQQTFEGYYQSVHRRAGVILNKDFGAVNLYGLAGAGFAKSGMEPVFMAGMDSAVKVGPGKAKLKVEYLYDNAELVQESENGSHLILGRAGYAVKNSSVDLNVFMNPTDKSAYVRPVVKYTFKDGVDFFTSANFKFGDAGTQYGQIPDPERGKSIGVFEAGLGYSF